MVNEIPRNNNIPDPTGIVAGKVPTTDGNGNYILQTSTSGSSQSKCISCFSPSSPSASISDAAALQITGNLTISAWIKPDYAINNLGGCIISKNDAAGNWTYRFMLYTNGELLLTQAGTNIVSTYFIPQQAWSYISVTRSGTTITFFYNGIAIGTATGVGSVPNTSGHNVNLFQDLNGGGFPYNGLISNINIWNVARTSTQLISDMSSIDPASSGLVGYWKCNGDPPATTILDSTTNGFTATISGNCSFVTTASP